MSHKNERDSAPAVLPNGFKVIGDPHLPVVHEIQKMLWYKRDDGVAVLTRRTFKLITLRSLVSEEENRVQRHKDYEMARARS